MKLPPAAHTSQPWRIHEIAPDFRLEDVWRLPARGGEDDFPRMVEMMGRLDPAESSSAVVRALFAIRWKVGALFGWDDERSGLGGRVSALRKRLPADLRDAPAGPSPRDSPFTPLYLTGDEWAAEIANETVHGVLHLGRVPDGDGGFHAQLAVLVKPNGLLGELYLAAIKPFRLLLVYPALMRDGRASWARVSSGG